MTVVLTENYVSEYLIISRCDLWTFVDALLVCVPLEKDSEMNI